MDMLWIFDEWRRVWISGISFGLKIEEKIGYINKWEIIHGQEISVEKTIQGRGNNKDDGPAGEVFNNIVSNEIAKLPE